MDWRKMCVITRQDVGLQCKTHGIGEKGMKMNIRKHKGTDYTGVRLVRFCCILILPMKNKYTVCHSLPDHSEH